MKKLPLSNSAMLLLSKILCYVFVVLTALVFVGGGILTENSIAINSFFGIQTQQRIDKEDDGEEKDYTYYKSVNESLDSVIENSDKISEEIVAEGSVLLKNENALPLKDGASVSLFGASSVYPALTGTGSGGNDKTKPGNDLMREGLKSAGLKVNDELYDWYKANKNYARQGTGSGTAKYWSIGDASWSQITTNAKTAKADAAVFVIARMGGEGADLDINTGDKNDMTDGDYLALSPTELDVLKNLKAEKEKGTFGKIVVIMNSAYQVCGLDDPALGVDALLWTGSLGGGGTYGIAGNRSIGGTRAIGNILAGKVNPSGKLSATFWKDHSANPAMVNFGNFTYSGGSGDAIRKNYVVYQEGIYMGYRYTETRYEDSVTGRGNAGAFDYYGAVEYPFGYGLSYTDFAYSDFKVTGPVKDVYTLSVKVTNTGSKAGKEAVQFYLQKPYTDYDIENKIEKASVELVGYAKTQVLDAGASETVSVEVNRREFASYDAYKARTYIVDAGDYYFTAARDAHDAANNILKAKNVAESKLSARGSTTLGDKNLVKSYNEKSLNTTAYSKSANGTPIVNRFDDADILLFEPDGANAADFKYTTRSDWAGTLPTKGVSLARTAKMNEMYNISQGSALERDTEIKEYPKYGQDNGLLLIDLRVFSDENGEPTDEWIPYDDPLWDEFLDQLTFKETVALLSNGFRTTVGLNRLGKPETLDHNGSGGVKNWQTNTRGQEYMLADKNDPRITGNQSNTYPCNATVASTFNHDLQKRLGEQWGEDALWVGYNGLYGPGGNLYRAAYNGRNFEYYSEDPFLSGMSIAAMSEGMSEKGLYIYLKHCVLNDQETNRHGINTWFNEQTMREVYLKAFQIAIEVGGVEGVMTGYNALGATWSGAQGFCKSVLHGEFGMTGIAVSDYKQSYMFYPVGVLNGNDLPDGQVTGVFEKYEKYYSEMAWAMRESAHHVLYTVVHSNVMNGVSASTIFIKITPAWVTALEVGKIVITVLAVLSALFLAYEIAAVYLNKKRQISEEAM
ncbi:MAG: hypothetical protein HFE48_00720 [Clostridia bacterium]|nr:hypothetical protein [Clostridia bacterium]